MGEDSRLGQAIALNDGRSHGPFPLTDALEGQGGCTGDAPFYKREVGLGKVRMVKEPHKDSRDAGKNGRLVLSSHLENNPWFWTGDQDDLECPVDGLVHDNGKSRGMEDGEDAEHALLTVLCIEEPRL